MELIAAATGEIIVTAAVALLSYYFKKVTAKLSEQSMIKDGVVAIMQDRILSIGSELLQRGEVSVSELKNLENMYSVYHSLGGNSTGTEIFNRVNALALKED